MTLLVSEHSKTRRVETIYWRFASAVVLQPVIIASDGRLLRRQCSHTLWWRLYHILLSFHISLLLYFLSSRPSSYDAHDDLGGTKSLPYSSCVQPSTKQSFNIPGICHGCHRPRLAQALEHFPLGVQASMSIQWSKHIWLHLSWNKVTINLIRKNKT